MEIQTAADERFAAAMRWCQWLGAIICALGLIAASVIVIMADRQFQWVGWVVGIVYAIPAIALMILGEYMKNRQRWAVTAAIIIFSALGIAFILNVIGSFKQEQPCGGVVAAFMLLLIILAIINLASVFFAPGKPPPYVSYGFEPVMRSEPAPAGNQVAPPPLPPVAAAMPADSKAAERRALGWIVGLGVLLLVGVLVTAINRTDLWSKRRSAPAPLAALTGARSSAVAATVKSRQNAPSTLHPVAPERDLDGAALQAKIMDRLGQGVFTSPKLATAETNYFHTVSTPGDFIGRGRKYHSEDSPFAVTATPYRGNNLGAITITIDNLRLRFAPPDNEKLEVGEYRNAKRFPLNLKDPGIEMIADTRGCNEVKGDFVIWQLQVKGNTVTQLALDFIANCERAQGHPLYGMIRYHSTVE